MNKTHVILIATLCQLVVFSSCKKNKETNEGTIPVVVCGDTKGVNIYTRNTLMVLKKDSLSLNSNGSYDFKILFDYCKTDCSTFQCPPNVICDCTETVERNDYLIKIGNNVEIAVDSTNIFPLQLTLKDTVSNKLRWSKNKELILIHNVPTSRTGRWEYNKDGYIGIRICNQKDTLYGWVNLSLKSLDGAEIVRYGIQQLN